MLAWFLWCILVVECALDLRITFRLISDAFGNVPHTQRQYKLYGIYSALKIAGILYVGYGAWFSVFSGYWFIALIALVILGAIAVLYHWQLLLAQLQENMRWNLGGALKTLYPVRKKWHGRR